MNKKKNMMRMSVAACAAVGFLLTSIGKAGDAPQKVLDVMSGVYGVKAEVAGEEELIKVAQEWAEDEGFYSIVVRTTDGTNWGIQFVYISADLTEKSSKKWQADLQRRFGEDCFSSIGVYWQSRNLRQLIKQKGFGPDYRAQP